MSCGRSLAPAVLLFALCSVGAVRAKDVGYVNVSVLTDPAPLVRFTSGEFTADIRFDEAGFVLAYPGIGHRAH